MSPPLPSPLSPPLSLPLRWSFSGREEYNMEMYRRSSCISGQPEDSADNLKSCLIRISIGKNEDMKYFSDGDLLKYMTKENGQEMVKTYKELSQTDKKFPRFGETIRNLTGYCCDTTDELIIQLLKFTNMFSKYTFIFYHFYSGFPIGSQSTFELCEKFEITGSEFKRRNLVVQLDYNPDQNLTVNLVLNPSKIYIKRDISEYFRS
jgi:hypothetical protein